MNLITKQEVLCTPTHHEFSQHIHAYHIIALMLPNTSAEYAHDFTCMVFMTVYLIQAVHKFY